jgi:spore maturation protein CgeB
MRVVLFYHSVRSDWNNGHAHFLRGICTELQARGHDVTVYEPSEGWSVVNLAADSGELAIDAYRSVYPYLTSVTYDEATLDLDAALDQAAMVIVHEWNPGSLIARIGAHRQTHRYTLLFHDTHHKSATDPDALGAYDLSGYDGVLAYGLSIRERYITAGWAQRVWVWHEAADVRVFRPIAGEMKPESLVWIGNWGDEERTQELWEYLLAPVQTLKVEATVYGVRYPIEAQAALRLAGCSYLGWLPNFRVPQVFARFPLTVHIPRRAYVRELPGVPTIRPFEALACGIPLVSAPWHDVEGLFTVGKDFLMARNEREMTSCIRAVLHDRDLADELSAHGRHTIVSRHTCAHRVDELLQICAQLQGAPLEGHPNDTPKEKIS